MKLYNNSGVIINHFLIFKSYLDVCDNILYYAINNINICIYIYIYIYIYININM